MKIAVKTSGGFANVQLGGEIDPRDLAPDLARQVEKHLTPEGLERASQASVDPEVADAQLYEVTLRGEDDEVLGRYTVNDSAADPAVGDTLAALVHELVRRRASTD